MQYNEKGVIKDTNNEFLHDYRVSIRKSRSVLTQLKDVYNKYLTDDLTDKFKTIANSTNQLRDFDVFLINQNLYFDLLCKNDKSLLKSFFKDLEIKRKLIYRDVVKDILSSEHKNFIKKLNDFLKTDEEKQKNINSDLHIINIVNEHINKRYNNILKLGNNIQTYSQDKKFHKLRIQFKKLRYLIELFLSLYSVGTLSIFIDELKEMQDHLGKINDYSIQRSIIDQYITNSDNNIKYRKMLSNLTKVIDNEKKTEIILFIQTYKDFIKPENKILFKKIFKI
ncbi:MAG: CHAD domain-containing protein [bacterium]|nr:CHAD domain-containing protein [bacterium]